MQSFMKNTQLKGAFLTLFGGICWGASGSVGQYLFAYEGMDSRWLVPIRLGLAGIILIEYSFFRYGKDDGNVVLYLSAYTVFPDR